MMRRILLCCLATGVALSLFAAENGKSPFYDHDPSWPPQELREHNGQRVEWFVHDWSDKWGARRRQTSWFAVVHPKDERPDRRYPMVVVLHCAGHNMPQAMGLARSSATRHDLVKTPPDAYALYLDCAIGRDHADYWWGTTPEAGKTFEPTPGENRLLDTVKWALAHHSVDLDRVYMCGISMGGSGTLGLGVVNGGIFAALKVNVPATIEHVSARMGFEPYAAPAGHAFADPPVVVDYSAQNDDWSRGHERFIRGMATRRYPLLMYWGMFGHEAGNERIAKCNDVIHDFDWMKVVKNAAYPVFTDATSDSKDLPWPCDKAHPPTVKTAGQINGFFRWENRSDTATELSMTLALANPETRIPELRAPERSTVDVSVRRRQRFRVAPGEKVGWSFGAAKGTVTAAADGLVTVPGLVVTREPTLLRLVSSGRGPAPTVAGVPPMVDPAFSPRRFDTFEGRKFAFVVSGGKPAWKWTTSERFNAVIWPKDFDPGRKYPLRLFLQPSVYSMRGIFEALGTFLDEGYGGIRADWKPPEDAFAVYMDGWWRFTEKDGPEPKTLAEPAMRSYLESFREWFVENYPVDPADVTVKPKVRMPEPVTGLPAAHPVRPKVRDRLEPVVFRHGELGGVIDAKVMNLVRNHFRELNVESRWLKHFQKRAPLGNWRYEGAGKVISAGAILSRYASDPYVQELTLKLERGLAASRDDDGYIGFWQKTPDNAQDYRNWTLHEQEYVLLGMAQLHENLSDPQALADARKMADYILATFPTEANGIAAKFPPSQICTCGLPEAMLTLYSLTGERKYLEFAANTPHGDAKHEIPCMSLREWRQDITNFPCHVSVMMSRAYAQTLLYRYEGDDGLLEMSRRLEKGLLDPVRPGLLVVGSCSEKEHFTYNQQGAGDVGETCATANMMRWLESLMRLTGDLRYGDVIERATYNALFAATSPDGWRIRYFTPFSGERKWDTHDNGYCCCGNFRRALAELPRKVCYARDDGALVMNLYSPFERTFEIGGRKFALRCETNYPADETVTYTFLSDAEVKLAFRRPDWCKGFSIEGEKASYRAGDRVRLRLPMPWRWEEGRALQEGRICLQRGPVVYCARGENLRDLHVRPSTVRGDFAEATVETDRGPLALRPFPDPDGREIYFLK